ncbi:MAG: hypothetical protein IPL33_15930 [Sphingobacteriales bacterium]|nr:hypothetical protein [Sphingobacteriales bacterium]MCC7224811.1 hypothetical protein [Chitinophagales bacterium]
MPRILTFAAFYIPITSFFIGWTTPTWAQNQAQVRVYSPNGQSTVVDNTAWRIRLETVNQSPADRYGKLPPELLPLVYYQGISGSENIAVYIGDFYSPADVEMAMQNVKAAGYADAFVIRFSLKDKIEGTRLMRTPNAITLHNQPSTTPPPPQPLDLLADTPRLDTAPSPKRTTAPGPTPPIPVSDIRDETKRIFESTPNDATNTTTPVPTTTESRNATPNKRYFELTDSDVVAEEIYFVQLGLFRYTDRLAQFKTLSDLAPVLQRKIEHENNLVTQVVLGPFAKADAAESIKNTVLKRQFPAKIIAEPAALHRPSNDHKAIFEYLFDKKL